MLRQSNGKGVVRDRLDVTDSGRGKVVGVERRDVNDSPMGNGFVMARRDVIDSVRGKAVGGERRDVRQCKVLCGRCGET